MIDNKVNDKLNDAISEAERFIKKAQAYQMKVVDDSYAIFGCKEGGAAKRASMDLSRSLSELRNSKTNF